MFGRLSKTWRSGKRMSKGKYVKAGLLMVLNTRNDVLLWFACFYFFYYGKFQMYTKVEINKKSTYIDYQFHQLSKFISFVLSSLSIPSLEYFKIN